MKVYVVAKEWPYEGFDEPEAAFSSKEDAVKHVESEIARWGKSSSIYFVFELEMNEPLSSVVYKKYAYE